MIQFYAFLYNIILLYLEAHRYNFKFGFYAARSHGKFPFSGYCFLKLKAADIMQNSDIRKRKRYS